MYYLFCLHPSVSAMAIMALNYAVAVYPLFLIFINYTMVKLYDHNFKPMVWVWKLFGLILKQLRRQWNVRTSLIDVFASFIYLSSWRISWTSASFLVPVTAYTYHQRSDGYMQIIKIYCVYTFPSVEYFSKEHLPFAILAIIMLFLFCILPMILLFVYPFHWFQKILNKVGFNSLILHTFMDVFQGGFKDGINGTRDYRYFSGLYLFLQLTLVVTFSQTLSIFYYSITSVWILLYLILHAAFQPYKRKSHNFIAVSMIAALMWGYCCESMEPTIVNSILFVVTLSIPFIYPLGLVCVVVAMKILH